MNGTFRSSAMLLAISTILSSGSQAHGQAVCVLNSKKVDIGRVTINRLGVLPFDVIARGVAVKAIIGASGKTSVDVRGSLEFKAVAYAPCVRLSRGPARDSRLNSW